MSRCENDILILLLWYKFTKQNIELTAKDEKRVIVIRIAFTKLVNLQSMFYEIVGQLFHDRVTVSWLYPCSIHPHQHCSFGLDNADT